MIPHVQVITGTSVLVQTDSGIVTGFLAVSPDGSLRFRGGTPWAPVDAPDQIEVIGAAMRAQVEIQRAREQEQEG